MRTEINAGGINETHSEIATVEDIRGAFTSHREALRWLAEFLTGGNELAEACLIDASDIAAAHNEVYQKSLLHWTRLATITSAIEMRRSRIAQLAPVYEKRAHAHSDRPQLLVGAIEFLIMKSDLVQSEVDILCRFVLVMCGVEGCSPCEAAAYLGISRPAVEAAYRAALEWVDVMYCQTLTEHCICAAAWN
jgi:DNA-directed RNA polymerase specialized sigma24 family protein